ncbi:MAG: dTDP-4-dehydrorhamnose reductase [Bryobacteraceae bacterium]|nr:dTDP-4-dehydrorhamnose reductase [Bryobacteraceae bacterium]
MADRVVIFGRAGQLGTELVRLCTERGCVTHAFGRGDVDVTNAAAVEELVIRHTPTLVYNATAYNMVDVAEREPEAAFAGNVLAVRNLSMACRNADAKFVHFSTDYVFDGETDRPYSEDDETHPLGAYAVSKLAGELFARAYTPDALIIRTCGVFGLAGVGTARGNFVETMLRLATRPDPIRVVEDYIASPTYAPELARCAVDLATLGATGIFHVGGGTPVSWFDFARTIFEEAGLNPELRPTNAREYRTPARRPRFSALSNAKMERLGVAPVMPLRDTVRAYMAGRTARQ